MAERKGIASVVAEKAPEECPDRVVVKSLDININFHNYNAYLVGDGAAECLGTQADACTGCDLRVASYTVDLPEGKFRIPTKSVQLNPK